MEAGALPGKPAQQPDLPVLLPQQALVPAAAGIKLEQVESALRAGGEVEHELAQTDVADRGPGTK